MPEYYKENNIISNNDETYEELLQSRGVISIDHYRTKTFKDINIKNIRSFKYTWTQRDTLHKLAVKFYGDAEFWWVIGLANGKPTDAHYKFGDNILIPISPDELRKE